MYPLRIIAALLLVTNLYAFKPAGDCSIMHNGKFKYMAGTEEVMVTINDSSFTENYKDGKSYVKAQINWLSECEYNIIIIKVNAPDIKYNTGDEINVKINRVEGLNIYYTATVKRVSWDGMFTKLQEQ